ncbi:MAG: ABC transporter permease [Planctomycetota bacterium]
MLPLRIVRLLATRAARAFAVVLAVAVISFFILRLAPGGPFSDDRGLSPAILKNLQNRYHLDEPIWQQLLRYLWNLLNGDLGPSFRHADFSVNDLIAAGFPKTAALGASALLFAIAVGIPLGALAAARRGSAIDRLVHILSVAGLALPSFVIGPVFVALFAISIPWFEPGGLERPADLILPAIALGLGPLAVILRLTRAGFLETLSLDFIRTARAKGVPERLILFRHALGAALAPVITYLGPACASILTGSLVVESVFAIPGIGGYLVRGATNRDYPVVLGIILLSTLLLVIANAVVDFLYTVLDPRIREEAS